MVATQGDLNSVKITYTTKMTVFYPLNMECENKV